MFSFNWPKEPKPMFNVYFYQGSNSDFGSNKMWVPQSGSCASSTKRVPVYVQVTRTWTLKFKTPNQGTHLPTLVHAIGHCAHFGAHLEFQACSTGLHPQIPRRHLLGLVSNRSRQLGVVEPHRTLHLVWELQRARNGHKEILTFWISSRYLQ